MTVPSPIIQVGAETRKKNPNILKQFSKIYSLENITVILIWIGGSIPIKYASLLLVLKNDETIYLVYYECSSNVNFVAESSLRMTLHDLQIPHSNNQRTL